MKKNGGSIHTIDILFPLLFILLFCFCALLVVLQGARIYEKTAAGLEENYTVRTAVSYLQEKVRECGDSSKITVKEMSGRQVLESPHLPPLFLCPHRPMLPVCRIARSSREPSS